MNKKKHLIVATTLVLLLFTTAVAYGWTLGGISSITTGIITMRGTSTTTASVATGITVQAYLWNNGQLAGTAQNFSQSATQVSATASGLNTPGSTLWECVGIHEGAYLGESKTFESYIQTYY